MATSPAATLLLALVAIGVLVVLVTWRKWNAFIALLLAALIVGIGRGLEPLKVLTIFQEGLGATLGGIAGVIALGAMLGKLLTESGGALSLAQRFNRFFGPARAMWCIVTLAILIGLVTWFAVGLLLMIPILMMLARESKKPIMLLAIPMMAFLSVLHGVTPPHPGAVVAIDALKANTGGVLLLGLLVGGATAFVAGPMLARWLSRFARDVQSPIVAPTERSRPCAGFGATLLVIALPIGLMMLSTVAMLTLPVTNPARTAITFIGHPVSALTIAVLLGIWVFKRSCGFTRPELLAFTEQSVGAIGMTLLVVGAGGGFARVLREAGVATALGELASGFDLHPLVYGWMIAAFIRVATGSATVAITTAAGLLGPTLLANPNVSRELMVLSLGFGSLFLSHLNDGGFWIVKESLGLTVGETLRTWTVMETVIGIVGLAFTLALSTIL